MSNTDHEFGIDHADEMEYEYEDATGRRVQVTCDAFENGESIRCYLYDESGDRLDYERFRIQSVDDRLAVAEHYDDGAKEADAVVRALHAGGWQLENIGRFNADTIQSDPWAVQMLDIRDGFAGQAKSADSKLVTAHYWALARAVEITEFTHWTADSARADGEDVDEIWERINKDVAANDPKWGLNEKPPLTIREQVEGSLTNAAKPETQRSDDKQRRVTSFLERARSYYRQGVDWDDARNQAARDHPDFTMDDDDGIAYPAGDHGE